MARGSSVLISSITSTALTRGTMEHSNYYYCKLFAAAADVCVSVRVCVCVCCAVHGVNEQNRHGVGVRTVVMCPRLASGRCPTKAHRRRPKMVRWWSMTEELHVMQKSPAYDTNLLADINEDRRKVIHAFCIWRYQ